SDVIENGPALFHRAFTADLVTVVALVKVIDLHAARDDVYRARSRRRRGGGGDRCSWGRRKSVERSQERICFGLQLFGLLQERLQPGLALLWGLHLRLDDLVDFFLLHSGVVLRQDRSSQN